MSDGLQRLLTGIPEDVRAVNTRGSWRRAARAWVLDRVAAPLSRWYGPRDPETFGILMYHRVAPVISGLPTPTWSVTPERLRSQLHGLLARGFQAWPLEKILAYRMHGRPLPPRTFAVTFDDGYENNLTLGFPILEELRVPATIFLATRYLDSAFPFPFDDWTASGSHAVPNELWRPLTRNQCRQLRDSGLVSLGAHTHSHGDFRNKPLEFAVDLEECLESLAVRFGISEPTLALPFGCKSMGSAGPMFSEIAEQAGCRTCLSTEAGVLRLDESPFDWGRFEATGHDTADTLAAKLDGWWDRVRQVLRVAKRAWPGSKPQWRDLRIGTSEGGGPALPEQEEILELAEAVAREQS